MDDTVLYSPPIGPSPPGSGSLKKLLFTLFGIILIGGGLLYLASGTLFPLGTNKAIVIFKLPNNFKIEIDEIKIKSVNSLKKNSSFSNASRKYQTFLAAGKHSVKIIKPDKTKLSFFINVDKKSKILYYKLQGNKLQKSRF